MGGFWQTIVGKGMSAAAIDRELRSFTLIAGRTLRTALLALGDEGGTLLRRLDEELASPAPRLCEILGIESRLIEAYPAALLKRNAWTIRERFLRVATPSAIAAWEASKPPTLVATDTPNGLAGILIDAVRADSRALLGYMHNALHLSCARERAVAEIQGGLVRSLMRAAGLLGLVVGIAVLLTRSGERDVADTLVALALLSLCGIAGAVVGTARRLGDAVARPTLANDALFGLVGLRTAHNGLRLTMLSGLVFALLALALFASGFPKLVGLDGGVFPTLARDPSTGTCAVAMASCEGALAAPDRYARTFGFVGASDSYKLLLFGFAAGFLEFLVPDILNRIYGRAKPVKDSAVPGMMDGLNQPGGRA